MKAMEHKVMRIDFASSASSTHPFGNAQVGCESETLASATLDKKFALGAANTLQALVCLSSLMGVYADDSAKVRVYAKLVDEKLQALGELMRPMLWSPA
jgi:hypothetical protein